MRSGIKLILLSAAGYLVASLAGSMLAGSAGTHRGVVAWRLAVWVVSAIIFGAHIVIERIRQESPPMIAARRAAYAVALGAFAVALYALIRRPLLDIPITQRAALALVVFPIAAGIPAFLVALVAARLVKRQR